MAGRLFQRYAEILIRYRVWTVVVMLLATALLASRLGTLRLDNNPDIWAPQNNQLIKTTHKLERIFGGRNFTVVAIAPKHGDIYQPAILRKIRNIQDGIEALPEAVKSNVLSLAAKRVKAIKGNAQGMVVTRMLAKIPQTPAALAKLRQEVAQNPVYINSLVSPNGKAAAVIADFRLPKNDARYAPLYKKIKAIADREKDSSVNIYLGGQPIEAATFEFAMAKMPLYFGIAFLIIMAIQYLAFRSIQGMLLPMVTAILSVVWGLSLMAILGIHMDALNTTTPILIMAVASGHSIQILKRYYEELAHQFDDPGGTTPAQANRRAVVVSITRVGPVMLVAGSIAALAFFSFAISDVAMIRHFGIFAGMGILSAVLIELSFIPALRAILPGRLPRRARLGSSGPLDGILDRLGRSLAGGRVPLFIVVGTSALLVFALVGTLHVKTDNSVRQYSSPASRVRKDDAAINRLFGGTDAIVYLVNAKKPDGIKNPKVLRAMGKLQAYLDAQPGVGKTESMVDLIKRMNQAMHADKPAFDRVPSSRALVAQYLLLYSLSGSPQDFDNLVDNGYQRAAIWVYLKTDSTNYAQALYARSKKFIARVFPPGVSVEAGGGLMQTVAINRSITDAKLRNIAQMAVVVLVLASLTFRSLLAGLLVVLPLVAIVLANLGIMGWLGIPLDMGTATITAMVTGIGADYEIYMLYRLREEYARLGDMGEALSATILTSGKAVLFVALAVIGGYSALLISSFGFYTRLSTTMMTTMVVSALLTLVFLRAIVALIKPRFIVAAGKDAGSYSYPAVALEEQ